MKNEKGEQELGFKNIDVAEEYVSRASKMWHLFSGCNENNIVMQFWTDILKAMVKGNFITEQNLYKYSEQEIVKKIEKCPNREIQKAFVTFKNTEKIGRSEEELEDKYCISIKAKKRYTNPIVLIDGKVKRIDIASEKGRKIIEEIKNYKDSKYAYLNMPKI